MLPIVTCITFGRWLAGRWHLVVQAVKRPCSPRSVPTLAPSTLPGPLASLTPRLWGWFPGNQESRPLIRTLTGCSTCLTVDPRPTSQPTHIMESRWHHWHQGQTLPHSDHPSQDKRAPSCPAGWAQTLSQAYAHLQHILLSKSLLSKAHFSNPASLWSSKGGFITLTCMIYRWRNWGRVGKWYGKWGDLHGL